MEQETHANLDKAIRSIMTDIMSRDKKGSAGFTAYCSEICEGKNPHIKDLDMISQFNALMMLQAELTTNITDTKSALYDKFRPEGFSYTAPMFAEGRIQTSKTFVEGYELLNKKLKTLAAEIAPASATPEKS